MSGLSLDRMQNIYTDLTSQISSSVKNIKLKQGQEFSLPVSNLPANDSATSSNYSIGGFSFSYLEPGSLYNLHRVLQEPTEKDGLRHNSKNQQQVADDDSQKASVQDNKENNAVEASIFVEELKSTAQQMDAALVARLYRQNDLSQASSVMMTSGSQKFNLNDIKYANDAYNFNFNINKAPDIRLEFMHKFNRSFDYKI